MAVKGAIACAGFVIILIFTILTFTASLITVIKVWDLKAAKSSNNTDSKPTPNPNPPNEGELNIQKPAVITKESLKYPVFSEYATTLSKTMNMSFKPCDDFYSYVCKNSPPTANEFGFLQEKTNEVMIKALTGTLPDFEAMNKLKAYMKKCFDATKTPKDDDTNGVKVIPRLDAFKAIANNIDFPILSDPDTTLAKPTLEQRSRILQYLAQRLVMTFTGHGLLALKTRAMTDRATSIVFAEPQLSFSTPKLYYYQKHYDTVVKPALTADWTNLVKKLAKVKKVTLKEAQLKTDIDNLVALDKYISEIVHDPTKPLSYQDKYTFLTAQQATTQAAIVDFKVYLTAYLDGQSQALKDKILADTYQFAVDNVAGLKNLADYLDGDKVDARTIYNFFYIRLLKLFEGGLSGVNVTEPKTIARVSKSGFKIPNKLPFPPPIPPKPRKEEEKTSAIFAAAEKSDDEIKVGCAVEVTQIPYLKNLVDRVYMDAILPKKEDRDAKLASIREVTQFIIDGFRTQINQLAWTPATKTQAYAKIDNLQVNLLYPETALTDAALNTEFSAFSLDDSRSHDEEQERIVFVLMKNQEFAELGKTTADRTNYGQTITSANAWYAPWLNSINIPEGILHPPFFHKDFPLAATYGSLGVVLGHEIVHGFDNTGVEFDSTGAINKWLDADSQKDFDATAKCIIGQYDEFKGDDGANVIGGYTQGENIADNGGMRAAYNAYKAHSAIMPDDPRLPADDLQHITNDQLFFVAFAREFCDNSPVTEESLWTDEHSPGRFRVFGTLQNFPPFRAAFNCRASEAYAKQKCEVYCKKRS